MKKLFLLMVVAATALMAADAYASDKKDKTDNENGCPGCIGGKFHLGLSTSVLQLELRNEENTQVVNFSIMQINILPLYNTSAPVLLSFGGGVTNNVLVDFTVAAQVYQKTDAGSNYNKNRLYAGFTLGGHIEYLFKEGSANRPIVGLDLMGGMVSLNDDTENSSADRIWNINLLLSAGERFFLSEYCSLDLAGFAGYMHVGYGGDHSSSDDDSNGFLMGIRFGVSGWL